MSIAPDPVAARPRWATARTERPTYIDEVMGVAAMLGITLSPWQVDTLEVATEYHPDTGRLWYREVLFSTPRQSGKSTWLAVYLAWRCTCHARRFGQQRAAYSAQNGKAARTKMINDWVPCWEESAMVILDTVRRSIGSESVTFSEKKSSVVVMTSMSNAAHGQVLDVGLIDEAFTDEDDRREQSLMPAMLTRPDPQLIICSTAGDSGAFFLKRKMELGRAQVESGEDSTSAYFEWSAPDDCDADDEDVWFATMPVLGTLQPVEAVRHARRTMRDSEFRRAFLNQWTATNEAAIPWSSYVSRCSPEVVPTGEALHVAVDCTPDREHGCIAIASKVDGGVAVELVENRKGLAWMLDEILERSAVRAPERIVLQSVGPLANLIPELEHQGLMISALTQSEMAAGAAWFYDSVVGGGIGLRSHEALDRAVQGARKVKMGDAFRWARTSSQINLAPLVAATMAAWSAHCSAGGGTWIFP